jgi:transposase
MEMADYVAAINIAAKALPRAAERITKHFMLVSIKAINVYG